MKELNPNWVHLRDELALLNQDLLHEIRRRSPQGQQGQLDQLQGLVLNEHEIVSFLSSDVGAHMAHDEQGSEQSTRRPDELNLSAVSQLNQITQLFRLSRIEERCLVLCLAAEIDASYSKVFAFLQDDITQKQPSIDLALRLFSNDLPQSIENRAIFSPNAPLLKNHLLQLSDSNGRHLPYVQLTLKLDERIAAFLLQTPQLERDLIDWVELVMPNDPVSFITAASEVQDQTIKLVEQCFAEGDAPLRPVIHLYGRPGTGKRSLAAYASWRIGLPLLIANVKRMPADLNGVEAFWRLGRESMLLPAVPLIENFDSLLLDNRSSELASLLRAVESFSPLTFLSGSQRWTPDEPSQLFLSLECPAPNSTDRMNCWRKHLHEVGSELDAEDLIEISSKFNFTEGQIRRTVEAGRCRAYWENPALPQLNANVLSQAASGIAAPNLGGLARKIETRDSWSDIVLPEAQVKQLYEIAAHVKRAQVIFEQWGFEKHFSYGKGVTALFEGPSGTGKTMAAGILARELGLDLHKIDLSSVVSKYIGETEKNLDRIFGEAQASNAVLFFDEADALFGKRSEVKDAHDRYANLEIAFLLQRMEEYSGIVILASNMRQNMDDAFVRRLRFIVPFPFPTEDDRELIWQKCFPPDAPLGEDVDFRWLARKVNVAGGNIKNISLRAAFFAVDREGVIDMDCLIDATKREIEKIGKVFAMAEFRPPARMTEVA